MNFFEHQEKARKHSRWIIVAFIGVTILIVLAVDLLVLLLASTQLPSPDGTASFNPGVIALLSTPQFWLDNAGLISGSSALTGGIIGIASLGKIAALRSGGGKVARDMGGVIVTPDTRDALRRRFYNVVEEISIASGTPVPEVYVMENEPAINAFAAGYSPADAAIAVTQGTLEKLNRAELQGVVAHEFSHILNGDMRINIRMMGVIFGITVLAILGRKLLSSRRYRVSSSRNKEGSAVLAIGLALMLIGYIGLFFARWMKSALSRQREYLADASAVQFTRDPGGISGALKKVAAYSHASYLNEDAEEISHMLFGPGYRTFMFATHPPIKQRISRVEKGFDSDEIERLAKKLRTQERREHVQAKLAEEEQAKSGGAKKTTGIFSAESMIDNIGSPEFERILAAALLTSEIPAGLNSAAHSLEWVPEVLFYCLLDTNTELREAQLLIVAQEMGDISEQKLSHLIIANPKLENNQRLPLLEICFPTLKRRPVADIEKILNTINLLVVVDNKVDTFEFLLSRLLSMYLRESKNPDQSRLHGKKILNDCITEISLVISIVASHGQIGRGAEGLKAAQSAYVAGMHELKIKDTNLNFADDWQAKLDNAIEVLDQLRPKEKNKVVRALAATVTDDGLLVSAEHEMIRAICSLIHVPLPLLQKASVQSST